MAFYFENLDLKTREYMIREIELDAASGTIYLSPRLRPGSENEYVSYLRAAARAHNEAWLAEQIRSHRLLKEEEERMTTGRGLVTLRVPVTAPDSLAEVDFNRFYSRAVCARAIDAGIRHVEVYLGKNVHHMRPESESVVGKHIVASALLQQLRTSHGVEAALGLPLGPHSGITLRLAANHEEGETSRRDVRDRLTR